MNILKHPQNMLHKLQDIYEAARYVLQDNKMVTLQSYHTPAKVLVTRPPVVSPMVPDVKTETFTSVMASFSKTIADAIQQGHCPHISDPTASVLQLVSCLVSWVVYFYLMHGDLFHLFCYLFYLFMFLRVSLF